MSSRNRLARLSGALYLIASVAFLYADWVRGHSIVHGNAALTASNIRAAETLFRAGLTVGFCAGVLYLLTAMALYRLFEEVNRTASGAMVIFVIMAAAVGFVDTIFQYAALAAATRPSLASALGRAGSDELVLLFTEIQRGVLNMNQLFAGLWLLPLGFLVRRSGFIPKLLGTLLVIGGCAWTAGFFVRFLLPELARIASLFALGGIAEVIFILWLLVRGAGDGDRAVAL